ncbi:restriction endonuclease subunit S [uncultured Acinetobacter sp.]|uniref:restriction endonuclease subunit S n=1 Tax=uncultured Acinetobacter sp. TaxID=165433 RepID=UPI00262E294E|nr:restriction endonuclease subunit S [uncultured Acinetobacter sp.]
MEFKQYPSYKNSGVEWLGEVPEGWEVKRLGNHFTQRKEKVSDKDFPPLSVTKNGIVPQLENAAKTDNGDNRKLVRNGDYVINSRSDRKGSSGLSNLDGSVSLINIVLKPFQTIYSKFSHYLFRSYLFQEEFYKYGHGIVADLWTTNYDDMRNIYLALPDINDQQKIVSFLDTETARIDNLISKQEKLIELLEEQRKSIISHAVTKGLNPNAPMKNSGVEWLGEVPEGWEVLKLRQLAKLESGMTLSLDKINDNGEYPVYGGNNIRGFTESYNMEGIYILIGRQGSLCGNINYVSGKFWATEHAVVVYPKKEVNIIFLGELLRTMNLNQYSLASAQAGLSVDRISNLYTLYAPITEQNQIAKIIKEENLKVDQLISKQKKLIEKLKEYRSSIISHAVTGKIDVRHHASHPTGNNKNIMEAI